MRTAHLALRAWQALALNLLATPSRSWSSPTTGEEDPSQDTFVKPFSEHAIFKANGGVANDKYSSCAASATYDHPQKPLYCREEDAVLVDNLPTGEPQRVRRTVSAGVTYAKQGHKTRTIGEETAEHEPEEAWVWTATANEVPQQAGDASGLSATTTDAARLDLRTHGDGQKVGNEPDFGRPTMDKRTQAMEYHQTGMKTTRPSRLYCHEQLALCTSLSDAKQAGGASSITSSGGREEADCFSSLLLEQGNGCSATDASRAHLTVGVFLLTQEWDTSGALDHFVAATTTDGGESLSKGGRHQNESIRLEWGAVWLAQAIQGRVHEAAIGFAANATAVGEGWAHRHLQSWRRHLSQKSSGIGMGGVIEGAERLVLAEANEENNNSSVAVVVLDLHLALARTLLLHGAFEEAEGYVRSSERLIRVAQDTLDDKKFRERYSTKVAAVDALRLEMALLSRTPVVAASEQVLVSLRRELMEVLRRMGNSRSFEGSIPNPLDVGVRAQFLLTYQGFNDKAAAIALGMVFDKASGGTLAYYSPDLLPSTDAPNDLQGPGIYGDDIGEEPLVHAGTSKHTTTANGTAEPTKAEAAVAQHVGLMGDPTAGGVDILDGNTNGKAPAGTPPPASTAGTAGIPQPENIVRVGFLSAHFRWHSVGRLVVGLLEELSSNANGLEIFVMHTSSSIDGDRYEATDAEGGYGRDSGLAGGRSSDRTDNDAKRDSIPTRLAKAGASIVWLTPTPSAVADHEKRGFSGVGANSSNNGLLRGVQEKVAALKLDVLVYGDVGMDALTTGLVHSRLAPVQVAFWGHPATTGLPITVDYFITSDLFEGERFRHCDDDGSDASLCLNSNRRGKRRRRQRLECADDDDDDDDSVVGGDVEKESEKKTGVRAVDETAHEGGCDGSSEAWGASSEEQQGCSRQEAFSEQLVRLGGLGIIFDDPVETFHTVEPSDDATEAALLWPPSDRRVGSGNDQPDDTEEKHGSNSPNDRQAIDYKMANSWGGDGPAGAGKEAGDPRRPRLYVCAQSLMKMHPAFDTVIAGILAEDPLAHIILIRDSRQLLWHSRFRRRLRAAVDAAEEKHSSSSTPFAAAAATATAATTATNSIDVSNNVSLLISTYSPAPSRDDTSTEFSNAPSSASDYSATSTRTDSTPAQQPREVGDFTADTKAAIAQGDDSPPQLKNKRQQQQTTSSTGKQFWSRVRFVSPLSGRDFFRLQCRADVVLDPFPFGGGVTILEALACGTPVVTSGAMQSVHRLAEGMITAVSASVAAGGAMEGLSQEGIRAEAGTRTTTTTTAYSDDDVVHLTEQRGGAGEGSGSDERVVVSSANNTTLAGKGGHQPPVAHGEAINNSEHGDGDGAVDEGNARRGEGNGGKTLCDDGSGGGSGFMLTENLVAGTAAEYVEKAVAVAASGQLRDRVRSALWSGRDGILRGDGSVAMDWERFLKNAAAAQATTVANVSDV